MNKTEIMIQWLQSFIEDLEEDPSNTVCFEKDDLIEEFVQRIRMLKSE